MKTQEIVTLVVKSEGVGKVTVDFDKMAKGIKQIELEARDAKGAIGILKDENKQLGDSIKREEKNIKAYARSLKELAADGDVSSSKVKAFHSLMETAKNRIIGYKAQMDKNNESIKQSGYMQEYLARNTKITDMTMNQLSKRAEYLRGKLNSTSKSLKPEEWKKYNNELIKVEAQQKKVAVGGEQVKNRFDSIGNTIKKVLPLMIAYGALRMFQNAIQDAKEFIKKSIEVAGKAEGVMRAFNKLNDPNLLSTLRRETKGLISDLNLMQSAVRADKFGIPVNDLAKYLKFAQQRAQETGQSVDYLAESIINGIGRKSKLVIDNLGISAAQLNDEIKKGASFAQAVTKIVDQELAKQGDLTLTTADKAQQAAVKWENAQLKVGNKLKWLGDMWSKFSGDVADAVADMAGETRTASQVYDDQVSKVASLQTETYELARRYDTLKSKTKLSKEEHQELNGIMKTLSGVIPGIITEFDQYGNILSINTSKVYGYIEAERARLKLVNKDAVESYEKQAETARKELAVYKERYEFLKSSREAVVKLYGEEYYSDQLKAAEKRIAEHGDVIKGAEAQIRYLLGKSNEDFVNNKIEEGKIRDKFNAMTEEQLKSWIKMHEKAAERVDEIQGKFVRKIEGTGVIMNTALGKTKALLDAFEKGDTSGISLQKQMELAKSALANNFGGGYGEGGKGEKESKILARQKEELKSRLENLETAHKYELMEIKNNSIKKGLTEQEYQKQVLESDDKYYSARIGVYDKFVKDFNVTNKKFNEDIKAGRADTEAKQFDLLPQFDANKLAEAERARDISLQILQTWVDGEKKTLEERNLGEEQRARELELIDIAETETRLAILQKYGMDVEALELQNGRIKAEAVKKASAETVKAEAEAEAKRNALIRADAEKNYSIRSGYGLASQEENKSREQRVLQDELKNGTIDYETYQKLLTQLNKKYEDERLQIKEQYGLASVSELYNMELENLKLQHEQGLLSEEEFEEAKFRLKMEYGAKWVEKYRLLQTSASDMVSALMEAETAKLDAEYDVRIEAAKGNAEEVERLENEKAQKKLDIEKKYADVQFAVKASEIIANTAVAIMTGYAQLGPIAGSVAAAMLAVTGAAQLIAANAERQKVKNMTLGGSSSDSNTQYQRINTPGLEEGGYIDVERAQDGKPFTAIYDPDKRGFVDKPTVLVGEGPAGESMEWVAGGSLVKNPTARPIIDLMDKAQTSGQASTIDMNRLIRARMAGFDTGGFISAPAASPGNNTSRSGSSAAVPDYRDILMEIYTFLRDNRLKAEINYQDFKTTEQIMSDYESFGNKY